MRKFLGGFLVGVLLVVLAVGVAGANKPLRMFVDGVEIFFPEAPPQIINGRVMVPARPLAEALGATVQWDEELYAVIITTKPQVKPKSLEASDNPKSLEAPSLGTSIVWNGWEITLWSVTPFNLGFRVEYTVKNLSDTPSRSFGRLILVPTNPEIQQALNWTKISSSVHESGPECPPEIVPPMIMPGATVRVTTTHIYGGQAMITEVQWQPISAGGLLQPPVGKWILQGK